MAGRSGVYYIISMNIQQNIPLAPLTTIRVGGPAQEYIACSTQEDVIAALSYAQEKSLPIHILGGGSNTIFSDTGFTGLVIHIQTKGIASQADGNGVLLTAQAGEDWDAVVQYAVAQNLTGLECMSGIPGSCGGTPFQNVGAYGAEVAQVIEYVDVLDRETKQPVRFSNEECKFAYRTSRFKDIDKGKYIITAVTFRLTPNKEPDIKYPELAAVVQASAESSSPTLSDVHEAVLSLRTKKSMVIRMDDPNSVSCGSFFTNPIIPAMLLTKIQSRIPDQIPFYPAGSKSDGTPLVKLSAAWLVEHAGFSKGTVYGNVGISENHSLAIINRGGASTNEVLLFAQDIQNAVEQKFSIVLEREPVVV